MAFGKLTVTPMPDDDDDDDKPLSTQFYAGLITPVVFVVLIVPMILLKAWVLTYLWKWYMIPIFGLPPLRMVFAFGLSLTANYLLPHSEPKEQGGALLWKVILSPLVALLLGWIGTWFI